MGSETGRSGVFARVLLTVAALAVAWFARSVYVPGLDIAEYEYILRLVEPAEGNRSSTSIVALWVRPLLFAFVAVEIMAMAIPRWRPLRAGRDGRRKLVRAGLLLTFATTLVQCAFIARWMWTNGLLGAQPGLAAVLMVLGLTAGLAFLILVAEVIRTWGLGYGLSLLLVLDELPYAHATFERVRTLAQADSAIAQRLPLILAAAVVLIVIAVRALSARSSAGHARTLPLCGLLPVVWGQAAVDLVAHVQSWGVSLGPLAQVTEGGAAEMTMVVLLTLLFAGLISLAQGASVPDARQALWRSLAFALAVVACDVVLGWQLGEPMTGTSAMLVLFTAVVLDLRAELSARRRMLAPVVVRTFHNAHAAARAQRALEDAGIPALARTLHHRALLLFMGPYLGIDLLVPRAQVAEAESELQRQGASG